MVKDEKTLGQGSMQNFGRSRFWPWLGDQPTCSEHVCNIPRFCLCSYLLCSISLMNAHAEPSLDLSSDSAAYIPNQLN